jgi:hypothetical protein
MKKSTILTHHEINDLIRKYQSELRKLEYQVNKIQEALSDLHTMQEDFAGQEQEVSSANGHSSTAVTAKSKSSSTAVKKQEAPAKKPEKAERKPKGRPGRKPKAKPGNRTKKTKKSGRSSGYRLSVWDEFILNALEGANKTLINSELYEQAKDYAAENKIEIANEKLRGKLSRSIHKLANKRKELVKVPYDGKGFAYALTNWVTAEGKLKQKYSR